MSTEPVDTERRGGVLYRFATEDPWGDARPSWHVGWYEPTKELWVACFGEGAWSDHFVLTYAELDAERDEVIGRLRALADEWSTSPGTTSYVAIGAGLGQLLDDVTLGRGQDEHH